MRKILALLLALTFCGTGGAPALAAPWPTEQITIICPMSPGGDTDFNIRLLSEYLAPELGTKIEVDNVIGGNGTYGMEYFIDHAALDGSSLLAINTNSLSCNELTGYSTYNYTSFDPVAIFAQGSGEAIFVRADSPYATFRDLIDAAKYRPNEISLGITLGGSSYVLSQVLEFKYKTRFRLFDGGDSAARLSSLREKRIDAAVMSYAVAHPHVLSGELRPLATYSSQALLENGKKIPPLKECGVDDFSIDTMYVLMAPKNFNADLAERLNEAILRITLKNEQFIKRASDYNHQKPHALSITDTIAALKNMRGNLAHFKGYL